MTGSDDDAPSQQKGWPRMRGRLFHIYFRLRRPMTLGVRGLVHNRADDTVFLIRHTYVPGWQLPGGGVEPGETMEEALGRELMEEGNIELRAQPELRSMHFNRLASRRDHVGMYLITQFKQTAPRMADREIAEAAFFPRGNLPVGTTPATLRRLAEVFDGVAPAADW
jgi:ADP-ribose pyrophosphatase YjhB (NUDIX family)